MVIPSEVLGIPAGALIIFIIAQLEQAQILPSRYAGLAAIVVATIGGTAYLALTVPGQDTTALVTDLAKAFLFGLVIVFTHFSVIKPVKDQATSPPVVPPAA